MTPLRQRMLEDMQVRNLSINTQTSGPTPGTCRSSPGISIDPLNS